MHGELNIDIARPREVVGDDRLDLCGPWGDITTIRSAMIMGLHRDVVRHQNDGLEALPSECG